MRPPAVQHAGRQLTLEPVVTVAALYVDARSVYAGMPGVEAWDATWDARRYRGPHPVVAHPPCGPWGRLRHLARGWDRELAPIAVGQVRRFGGVLEHPKGSGLWAWCGLPRPGEPPDGWGGRTVEVRQVEWGHTCRKSTWLYCVRTADVPAPPLSGRAPTHWIAGSRNGRRGDGSLIRRPAEIRTASAEMRRRTPALFAEMLVATARTASGARGRRDPSGA